LTVYQIVAALASPARVYMEIPGPAVRFGFPTSANTSFS